MRQVHASCLSTKTIYRWFRDHPNEWTTDPGRGMNITAYISRRGLRSIPTAVTGSAELYHALTRIIVFIEAELEDIATSGKSRTTSIRTSYIGGLVCMVLT